MCDNAIICESEDGSGGFPVPPDQITSVKKK